MSRQLGAPRSGSAPRPGAHPAAADLDALAGLVRAAPPRAGSTRVVAVDGPSGSGKSTLAARLAEVLADGHGARAPVVHVDDVYPGWDGLEEAVPRLVAQVLHPLADGSPAAFERYDWVEGRYAEVVPVPVAPVLVVEGVGSGARACAPHLSALVWVEAPREVRFARGIERDGEAYLPHWERWALQEERHFAVERTRERADVRVDGTLPVRGG